MHFYPSMPLTAAKVPKQYYIETKIIFNTDLQCALVLLVMGQDPTWVKKLLHKVDSGYFFTLLPLRKKARHKKQT